MTTNVVGRAEYKLAGALKAFKINLREKYWILVRAQADLRRRYLERAHVA